VTPSTAQTDAAPVALPVRTGRGRHQPARQIELVLPAVPQSARTARSHAEAALNVWDLPHLIDSATLITSELVTNAIAASTDKAPEGKEGRPVILSLTARDGELITRVWDADPEMPPPGKPAPDDPYPEGGRGLLIIAELSTKWGWHPGNGGKYVWASLPISPPAP
jgi:anti-sigma regulatory factor (Ser/Thr protein kinase)